MQGKKVLILEDAIFVREMEKKFLRGLGLSVFVETNSETDALELLTHGGFGLAIVDLNIAEGSGESAIGKIRGQYPTLPIAVVTSFPDRLKKNEPYHAQYDIVLPKPFSEAEFRNRIGALVHG